MYMYGNSERRSPLYKMIMLLLGLMLPASMLVLNAGSANAEDSTENATATSDVCGPLDSGKIDREDNPESVTVTAPGDQLISGYCVKAGSTNQEEGGPVYVQLEEPVKTLTIKYPDGRRISHYSVSYTTPQPPDKVEYGEWVDGAKDCESKTVTETRTKTVTTYKWVDGEWVAQTPVVTTETRTRPMTEAELKECAGDQPDDKVTYSEWVEGEPNCESKTVTKTRTKTVTPYKWNGSEWVLDTANAVTTTETETRPLTEAELKECEPPVVVPPTCPNGTPWTDTNGNGMMDECNPPVVVPPVVTPPVPPVVTPPEVTPPKPVKVVVKKADKCGPNNSYYVKRVKGAYVTLFGKKVREGVWHDTKRSRLVLKAKVGNSEKFELVGKDKFVLVFSNDAPCHDTPDVTPPAGG
jgi:hypothetical protein